MAKTKNKSNGFHHFAFCEVGERVSLPPGLAGCHRKHTNGTIFLATDNRSSLEEFATKHGFPYYEVMVDSPDPFRIPTRRIYIENKVV